MFTNAALNASNWLQQKDHGSSIYTRPVLDNFSFGSRWVLVRSSFVSRSSLVAYSLVYRRPNEDRTRIGRISNERRTKEGRKKIEKMTRNFRRRNEKLPNLMWEWQPSVFVKPNEQNRTFRTWGKVNVVRLG